MNEKEVFEVMNEKEVFDVLVIGCGAVGAAVAREMTLLGKTCMVLEKNEDVLSEASSRNTGHLVRSLTFFYFSPTHRPSTTHPSIGPRQTAIEPQVQCYFFGFVTTYRIFLSN